MLSYENATGAVACCTSSTTTAVQKCAEVVLVSLTSAFPILLKTVDTTMSGLPTKLPDQARS
jgi:hypothetical protein